MRQLHGVVDLDSSAHLNAIKRPALLFDQLHVMPHSFEEFNDYFAEEALGRDYQFLKSRGFLTDITMYQTLDVAHVLNERGPKAISADPAWFAFAHETWVRDLTHGIDNKSTDAGKDLWVRTMAVDLSKREPDTDVAPLCRLPLPRARPAAQQRPVQTVLTVALQFLPSPDETCSWMDIFDFKAESHDKQWGLRRFLHDLATKKRTEAEITDDIEWTINEYTKAMGRFKLKRSVSFAETYVIPTVEALEGFKLSSLLKGLVAIRKRKIELLDGEATAAGRECAYVFDARRRFGGLESKSKSNK